MNNNHSYEIFCDSLQEGIWFKNLHSDFRNADLRVIPNSKKEQKKLGIDRVLQYDRPDIVLKDRNQVIFVLERTVVPSEMNKSLALPLLPDTNWTVISELPLTLK